ncbi:hypothetical protein JJQ72_08865 [Paenibacillus sp. F411]|uniref:hypothetical protein n=1 Tax=Paenibacillus sp. F411 TaxID=2820239 RepID=UPI001AAE97D9|nr:hypothetical protein [Paenibacillus sp. F411]MBO2944076.1 hypothetical protein [Paenibacillus sp. F411]
MRMAAAVLLAVWLLLMGYQFFTMEPIGFQGEVVHYIGGCLLFFQLLAWPFVFKVPKVTCGFMLFLALLSWGVARVMNPAYYAFVAVNAVFALLSYGGHRELARAASGKNI